MSKVDRILVGDTQLNQSDGPQPLVHYRKKDKLRELQLGEMHDTVAGKVEEVMASFQETPSRTQLIQESFPRKHRAHRRKLETRQCVPGFSMRRFFSLMMGVATTLLACCGIRK